MTDYSYDNADQLLSAGAAPSQSYDAAGNRNTAGNIVGPGNRLLFDGKYYYSYDAEGNRTSQYQLDAHDNEIDVTTYTWDSRNRLVSVTTPTDTVTYTYDVFNRLASRMVDCRATEYYIYDGRNLVLVLGAGANVIEREFNGAAVDQVFASESPLPLGEGTQVDWFLTDNQGTVRDVVAYDTLLAQTSVVDHLVYDAFGNITSQTNAAAQPRFTYTGQRFDFVTGLYYDGARWYDAVNGVFVSQDPKGFSAGDANLSRYVGNDPTNLIDPSGMDASEGMMMPPQAPGGNGTGMGIGGPSPTAGLPNGPGSQYYGPDGGYGGGEGGAFGAEGGGFGAGAGGGFGRGAAGGASAAASGGQGIGNGDGFSCPCWRRHLGSGLFIMPRMPTAAVPRGAMQWPCTLSWSC